MNYRICKAISLVVLLVLFGITVILSACEPETKITFQNPRNEDVKLFVTHVREDGSNDGFSDYGVILAQTSKIIFITFLGDEWVNRLEIRDTSGRVLLSQDYKRPDLKQIGWKITVPP